MHDATVWDTTEDGWLAGWLVGWLAGWLVGWLLAGCDYLDDSRIH
jgi:hypothetical protein